MLPSDDDAPWIGKRDTPVRCRPLRGQVVIRERKIPASALIWGPEGNPRDVKSHRGVVIAMGEPAHLFPGGPEVPHGFVVGDEVVFHFNHLERAWTRPWVDGVDAVWVPQALVDGVIE
jgi:hypothetical protein